MTNTFSSDQERNGTTNQQGSMNADQGNRDSVDLGNELQQQISIMQKRIGDKDTHISTIEKENQVLREKLADIDERLNKMSTVEDALERMKEQKPSSQDTALDEDTLKSVMRGVLPEAMQEYTAKQVSENNFKEVSATLTKLYGADKVDEIVSKVAQDNGMTFDDMVQLARKSPKAVYRMAGVDKSAGYTPTHSTNNGYNEKHETREEQLAYYSKLRREDPKKYYSPEVQKRFREVCLSK